MLGAARNASLTGENLVTALRSGGYVILMRHASSPPSPPDAAHANPDNVGHERQLDDDGRASARAMGDAWRRLRIPIGTILSSPTYRALETIRLGQLSSAKTYSELGDAGHSMQADPKGQRGAWIRAQISAPPAHGTNTLIVTHLPNIAEAFPEEAKGLQDGAALIFHPEGQGRATRVGKVRIEDWPRWTAVP